MSWPGGKDGAGVAQRLINQIPPHRVFVSAFLGDCAVLRRIRPADLSIGIDLDSVNVRRWAEYLRGRAENTRKWSLPDGLNLRLYCCDSVEWLRHATGFYLAGSPFLAAACTRGTDDRSVGPVPDWTETFVYCDPPYRLESRRSRRPIYRCEMTEAEHVKLLETLNWAALQAKCRIMVQHYPCDLYAQQLADWRTFRYRAQTRSGRLATEQVWCSYPEPTVLHDTRFLGENKRRREVIRRRVRRWRAGLERMNPLERQAVLDGLGVAE